MLSKSFAPCRFHSSVCSEEPNSTMPFFFISPWCVENDPQDLRLMSQQFYTIIVFQDLATWMMNHWSSHRLATLALMAMLFLSAKKETSKSLQVPFGCEDKKHRNIQNPVATFPMLHNLENQKSQTKMSSKFHFFKSKELNGAVNDNMTFPNWIVSCLTAGQGDHFRGFSTLFSHTSRCFQK